MGFVDTLRHVLGISAPERAPITPEAERQSIQRRLKEHELRLGRMDVKIEVQRASLKNHIAKHEEK